MSLVLVSPLEKSKLALLHNQTFEINTVFIIDSQQRIQQDEALVKNNPEQGGKVAQEQDKYEMSVSGR